MTISAIILVILSAFLHAIKVLLLKKSKNKEVFAFIYNGIGFIVLLPVVFIGPKVISNINLNGLVICAASGFLHFLFALFQAKSLKSEELSIVYPIMRSYPILVLPLGILILGEECSTIAIIGIILVVFGVYIVNMSTLDLKNLMEPLNGIIKGGRAWALLAMIAISFLTIVDNLGIDIMRPEMYLIIHTVFMVIFYAVYILTVFGVKSIKSEWMHGRVLVLFTGIFTILGGLLVLFSYKIANVSYVSGLRQISIIFVVIFGYAILKERNLTIRLFASFFITSGAYMITIG